MISAQYEPGFEPRIKLVEQCINANNKMPKCRSDESNLLIWPHASFLNGSPASNDAYKEYSFSILDSLVALARAASLDLATVTLVGHSAGAQSLQRYAGDNNLTMPVTYIMANPGTYLYRTDQRVSVSALSNLNSTCPPAMGTAACSLTAADLGWR